MRATGLEMISTRFGVADHLAAELELRLVRAGERASLSSGIGVERLQRSGLETAEIDGVVAVGLRPADTFPRHSARHVQLESLGVAVQAAQPGRHHRAASGEQFASYRAAIRLPDKQHSIPAPRQGVVLHAQVLFGVRVEAVVGRGVVEQFGESGYVLGVADADADATLGPLARPGAKPAGEASDQLLFRRGDVEAYRCSRRDECIRRSEAGVE